MYVEKNRVKIVVACCEIFNRIVRVVMGSDEKPPLRPGRIDKNNGFSNIILFFFWWKKQLRGHNCNEIEIAGLKGRQSWGKATI